MDKDQCGIFMFELVEIKKRLGSIIRLLEYTKTHHHIQLIPSCQPYIYKGGNLIPAVEDTGSVCCICGDHKSGELTGGWHCPVHGQCF